MAISSRANFYGKVKNMARSNMAEDMRRSLSGNNAANGGGDPGDGNKRAAKPHEQPVPDNESLRDALEHMDAGTLRNSDGVKIAGGNSTGTTTDPTDGPVLAAGDRNAGQSTGSGEETAIAGTKNSTTGTTTTDGDDALAALSEEELENLRKQAL
jgi:hypothetical protein